MFWLRNKKINYHYALLTKVLNESRTSNPWTPSLTLYQLTHCTFIRIAKVKNTKIANLVLTSATVGGAVCQLLLYLRFHDALLHLVILNMSSHYGQCLSIGGNLKKVELQNFSTFTLTWLKAQNFQNPKLSKL